ncbi:MULTISPECIES: WecB/TagA/CpsF family glycosyltransferase [Pseudomonas]|uniref:WecB/TagA/CpsF family glycosyltransferase n=1 Tax=Pseudomonas luteola TaxID=47886 RepID=A0ABS0MMY5_PSELU|nr:MULTISPECIES: WecB/TagA/CpsF family glycosyltransferase [Pseudomonas]MBH3438089.1 WecB/TagA/CpsF family glycosyltransferase [Pseudomonas luteola]MBW5413024.1 WecB/TagA/CpsF family glycosyltransferase [Pseudomonas sp. MAG002Y]RRW41019.1 glycosyltransferase [Pseudomonas luteola]
MSNGVVSQAFGIDFFLGTKDELLKHISASLKKPYTYIVTPNIDHVVQFQENENLQKAYRTADKRVCDSRILSPLLKSLGVEVKEVITGSDLTVSLLKKADQEDLSITLIGSEEKDVVKLKALYPRIRLNHYNPPMGFINKPDEVQKCLDFIYANPSDLIFYAVGAPRQEMLASMVDATKRTGVGLCIGASILFATGSLKRAPVWMQKARIEWLHRMLSEPQRLVRRYVHDATHILPIYLKERSGRRSSEEVN